MAERPIGIYVHWPFCQSKCPYCDFNSHVVASVDQAEWRAAYAREIERHGTLLPDRIVGSVFFGGGTPSLMESATVASVIERIRATWRTTNDLEITLEANPTSVEAERFRGYRAAGVNRVSMGIQALNDADLRRLGRLHSVAEARAAFDVARATFERVSFDLMYARQDQSLDAWREELQTALELSADHLSLYQLTIEDGTAFGERARVGALRGLPDEDLAADLYDATQELCEAAGLPAYEVSNHARPGAESRHNMIYWSGGDYVGIGPGAHGRLTLDGRRHATQAIPAPSTWLARVRSGDAPDRADILSSRDVAEEYAMMALRVRRGADLAYLHGIPDLYRKITDLEDMGVVVVENDRLGVTPQGRPLLNAILRELLA